MNLKLFRNHGGIYRFKKRIQEIFWRGKLLGVLRNMRGYILEVNSEGLGW